MTGLTCAWCGAGIAGRRAGTLYCSVRCRVAACRARKLSVGQQSSGRVSPGAAAAVTPSEQPVTLTRLVGGPCSDPQRCEHRWRFPNGPWTCAHNHPRDGKQHA